MTKCQRVPEISIFITFNHDMSNFVVWSSKAFITKFQIIPNNYNACKMQLT